MPMSWNQVRTTPARLAAAPALLMLAVLPALLLAAPAAADEPPPFTLQDPGITESSGLQASARHPGVYWTHNDSEFAPEVFAVDGETGETLATVSLSGVEGRDIEAISLGPDGDLYVGDIGDNFGGEWTEVWIYRFPEPERLADATVTPAVYPVQYGDGPRDAEALMVHPVTGRVYLASKSREGDAALYAGPEQLTESAVNTFTAVADLDVWVTDGAFSPDGTRLMLRGYFTSQMYRWRGGDAAPPVEPIEQQVAMPFQEQGESVTFTPDGATLMLGSEGERSPVEPVALSGDLLPDSAAGAGAAEGDANAPPAGEGGQAADAEDGGPGIPPGVLVAALAAIALVITLRRVLPSRGGSPD